jgi:hypothetical protein
MNFDDMPRILDIFSIKAKCHIVVSVTKRLSSLVFNLSCLNASFLRVVNRTLILSGT